METTGADPRGLAGACAFDWHAVAKVFYAAIHHGEQEVTGTQHAFSSETEATLATAIPILEWLQTRWEQMAGHGRAWPIPIARTRHQGRPCQSSQVVQRPRRL
jgi:hypothetical protein